MDMLVNELGNTFGGFTQGTQGTGLLQKGHGIAIGNLFHDGQPAIFAQMGGMVPGDRYYCSLFKNPGSSNHWIDIKLVGAKTNRSAIGVRPASDAKNTAPMNALLSVGCRK